MSQQFKTKQFTDLDFFESRDKLISFLRSKTEFQDFDYDGPMMRLLIDALAYTTHQLAIYANMSLTECFIDSAQIRGSVVSHARTLGYTPRSRTSSTASVTIVVSAEAGRTDLYIPEYSTFTSQTGNVSYSFFNPERVDLEETSSGVYEATFEIVQGTETQSTFVYQAGIPNQLFTLPNREIDRRYIRVSSDNGNRNWVENTDVVGLTDESDVFFVQEGPDGYFQIYFGDGVIGSLPSPGETFVCKYFVSNGETSNGVNVFDFLDDVEYIGSDPTASIDSITTVQKAEGGSERESTESVRLNAPATYRAQNRTVTKEDYLAILKSRYGFIQTISVWGGEENDPPYYGKTFVSIKPNYGSYLSTVMKEKIKNETMRDRSIVAITPEIVDPDYTYIRIDSDVAFRKDLTPLTDSQIVSLVNDAIEDYFNSSVTQFDSIFRYSKLCSAIDDAHQSILSNATRITLKKTFSPLQSTIAMYTLQFNNEIQSGTVESSEFENSSGQTVQFKDSGSGKLDLYVDGFKTVSGVGTIDYTTGKVVINSYSFPTSIQIEIDIYAKPTKNDVKTVRNNLIVLSNTNIDVIRVTE